MALSRPALDKVKDAFSLLYHSPSLLVTKSVDARVFLFFIKEMSFFRTIENRLKMVEQMLGTLMVGLEDVALTMNIYISYAERKEGETHLKPIANDHLAFSFGRGQMYLLPIFHLLVKVLPVIVGEHVLFSGFIRYPIP